MTTSSPTIDANLDFEARVIAIIDARLAFLRVQAANDRAEAARKAETAAVQQACRDSYGEPFVKDVPPMSRLF